MFIRRALPPPAAKPSRLSFRACKLAADGISRYVCRDERCVARGRRLLWNISPIYPKLGRVRRWFSLMFVLAGAWLGFGDEGGQIAGTQTDVPDSSFEVLMKRSPVRVFTSHCQSVDSETRARLQFSQCCSSVEFRQQDLKAGLHLLQCTAVPSRMNKTVKK